MAERGWKGNYFIREIKAENEREKRANEGINQLESENIEAREVAERGKEREGSTLQ